VGQSKDGIRNRVRRHLTSARSDVIANRQLDVWEVAFVWAWPAETIEMLDPLESHFFHLFNAKNVLMNGSVPEPVQLDVRIPNLVRTQLMTDEEISARKAPERRLPRQAAQFGQLLDHILNIKDSQELHHSLTAHYQRLSSSYEKFIQSD
jgi:hypothetical protein